MHYHSLLVDMLFWYVHAAGGLTGRGGKSTVPSLDDLVRLTILRHATAIMGLASEVLPAIPLIINKKSWMVIEELWHIP